MSFVWTYLALLLGLDRLGQERLSLDPFPQDTSLGLGAVSDPRFGSAAARHRGTGRPLARSPARLRELAGLRALGSARP